MNGLKIQFTDAKLFEFAWLSKKVGLLAAFNTVPRHLWSKVLGITVSVAWQSSQSIVYIKTQLRTFSQTGMTKKAGAGISDRTLGAQVHCLDTGCVVSPSLFSLVTTFGNLGQQCISPGIKALMHEKVLGTCCYEAQNTMHKVLSKTPGTRRALDVCYYCSLALACASWPLPWTFPGWRRG